MLLLQLPAMLEMVVQSGGVVEHTRMADALRDQRSSIALQRLKITTLQQKVV